MESKPYKTNYMKRKRNFFIYGIIGFTVLIIVLILFITKGKSRIEKIYIGKVVKIEGSINDIGLVEDLKENKSIVLAGPWHPAFGHLVFSKIFYDKVINKMEKINKSFDLLKSNKIILTIHPKSESKLRGDKNLNLEKIKSKYSNFKFLIKLDKTIAVDEIKIYKYNI